MEVDLKLDTHRSGGNEAQVRGQAGQDSDLNMGGSSRAQTKPETKKKKKKKKKEYAHSAKTKRGEVL